MTADLVKVGFASNANEYKGYRAEAEKSLAEVKAIETKLQNLKGKDELEAYQEFSDTAGQLFAIIEGRLQSGSEAVAAGGTLLQKLTEAVKQLKELDGKIKLIQSGKNATFSNSFEKTKNITGSVRKIENLNAALKDLQLASGELLRATGRKQVLVAKGRSATALSRMQQNDYLKVSKAISLDDIHKLAGKLEDVQKAQLAVFEKPSEENKNLFDAAAREMNELLSGVILATEQESGLVSEAYNYEVGKQGTAYAQSNSANAILTLNAELLAQGLAIEGQTARLFSLDSVKEITATSEGIRKSFEHIEPVVKNLDRHLRAAGALNEERTLQNVVASLHAVQNSIFAEKGIIAKLSNSINMTDKSRAAMRTLREIVIKQSEKGRETITNASSEQTKAIESVNRLVKMSISGIAVIGIFAVVFGMTFGLWIYRSISKPLGELVHISDFCLWCGMP